MGGELEVATPHIATLEFTDPKDRTDFARFVGILRREWEDDSIEAVVLRALREAAARA